MHIASVVWFWLVPESQLRKCRVQLIVLARASWRFPHMAQLTHGDRKFAGTNRCQVSLHCQVKITATIARGIQVVLSVE